jgi:beta-lactamase class A
MAEPGLSERYSIHLGIAVLVGTGFLCGALGWFGALYTFPIKNLRGAQLRQSSEIYPHIKPLLACEIGVEPAFSELAPIKRAVERVIDTRVRDGNTASVSVYFRQVVLGKWFEINAQETYAPASLLKVFVMMAFFKEANETDNPALLQKKVRFQSSQQMREDTPGEIIPHFSNGRYYTIDELIRQMIVYSDNDALNTLLDNFDDRTLKYFEIIFKDLNIPSPVTQKETSLNFMNPAEYSLVFRVLYSATYLSERYSEKALRLLTEANYKGGLNAGIPSDIEVAHKFGDTTASGLAELHDCGIVYLPQNPYLLCVMTKGKDFASLQDTIASISKIVYQEFQETVSK